MSVAALKDAASCGWMPGGPAQQRIARGELARARGVSERGADADDGDRTGGRRPLDHAVAVLVERRIGEMGVTIDESHRHGRRADDATTGSS